MTQSRPFRFGRRSGALLAALVILGAATAGASSPAAAPGRIDFSKVDLPPANVEVNLSQGMLADLFGIGDAAAAGVAEALSQAVQDNEGSAGTELAAKKLAAARQVVDLATKVVQGVQVRIYDDLGDGSRGGEELMSQLDGQLRAEEWENAVQIHDGDETVRVSLLRAAGAVRGLFVIVADGDQLVLVNVICDVSPERVTALTEAATKLGLENGLQPMIEAQMRQFHRQFPQGPEHGHSNGHNR